MQLTYAILYSLLALFSAAAAVSFWVGWWLGDPIWPFKIIH